VKHAGKTCSNLWGQSIILKAISVNCVQAERGWGVTPIINLLEGIKSQVMSWISKSKTKAESWEGKVVLGLK